jgi:hypothetical protein
MAMDKRNNIRGDRSLLVPELLAGPFMAAGLGGVAHAPLACVSTVFRKVVLMKHGGILADIETVYREHAESKPFKVRHSYESEVPAHDDLVNTFARLTPHFLMLTEMEGYDMDSTDRQLLDMMHDGIPGDAEHRALKWRMRILLQHSDMDDMKGGVQIHGQRRITRTSKAVPLLSPLIQWGEDYPHMRALQDACEDLWTETRLYLQGKHAMGQLEMFGEEIGADGLAQAV